MANITKVTPEKVAAFLDALSESANVSSAAKKIKVSRTHLYRLRDEDEEFAAAWNEAVQLGTAALEDEAVRRAKVGTLRPVFYKGEKCGEIREYSDTLLIFLLKARDPDKYADRVRKELTGPGGGPIQQQTQISSVAEFQEVLKGIIDEV
ncbi:hypothetical protein AAFM71_07640 [Chromobacterium violaceum]|uniref:Terminase n=1 Tax=Chromobacterium violaceum TaxID=536 RepID=A0A202B5T5_CHRVL|nr:terminase [Chromobacterium violaceum]OVE46700.1 terminase [Chromobacterium violaceum]